MTKPTYQEFEKFYDSLSQNSQKALSKAPFIALASLCIELRVNIFEASKLYFPDSLIREMRSLSANSKNVFCQWVEDNAKKIRSNK